MATKTRIRRHPLIVLVPGTISGIESFITEAARLDPRISGSVAHTVTEIECVETCDILGLDTVIAQSSHPWHDDDWGEGTECYSALLVIRNDAGSWVETREKKKHRNQPIGTLVLLDIQREHRLTCRERISPEALWVAVNIDYVKVPKPEQCIADMQRLVDQARQEHTA